MSAHKLIEMQVLVDGRLYGTAHRISNIALFASETQIIAKTIEAMAKKIANTIEEKAKDRPND